MSGGRVDVRERMLDSLVESQHSLGENRLVLSMLLQNQPVADLALAAPKMPSFVRQLAISGRVPLSTARNMLLRQVKADGMLSPDALVAFPDDDCWYPPGFLSQVAELFTRDESLDFWFCRYASQPLRAALAGTRAAPASIGQIVRNASSNTMFLRGRLVAAIGEFDEALGVGTPMGGSEDIDYALRAQQVGRKTIYCDAVLVGHRDKSPAVRANYYRSSLLVLARHARHGATKEFLRKIAVGIYLVSRRELRLVNFTKALRAAMPEWRAAKSKRSFAG
jgi:Glycosyltransferase like family 2